MLACTVQDIHYTHTVHLKSGLGLCCTTRSVSFLLQDGCLLSNTHHKRQLKGMCDTGCVWERESRDEKKSEMRWDMSERIEKERKYTRENVQQHLSFKTTTDTVSIDLYYNSGKL